MLDTFDVGSVLGALGGSDVTVVAGADGLSRPVRRACMVSQPQHLDRPKRDELMVTTTGTLLYGEPTNELVRRLHAAGTAGAAVRLDADEPLPPQLLTLADSLGFPIITFPATTALGEVTTAILNALLDAQSERLERVLDIREQFTSTILGGGGVPEVTARLHELLGRPVAVIDDSEQPVVASDAEWSEAAQGGDPSSVTRYPILAGDHRYGDIVIDSADRPLDTDELLAVERASVAIAVRLAHARATAAAQERFEVTSLEELISGYAVERADVAERASSFGWDLARRRAVLLASIDPPVDPATSPTVLAAIAAAARATLGANAIVWQRSAAVAALVAPDTVGIDERRRIADNLRCELDRSLNSVTVSVGVGRCAEGPLELPRSYLEARRAVEVGRWVKGRHATEVYDGLGLDRLLGTASPDDLVEFVEQAIGPLLAHDHTHQTELVETLGVFLETRNMAEAARRLFVHYNTLKNRLERIESVVGAVVDDADRSLEAQVAIHVLQRYDGPWTGQLVPPEDG